ncbi:MAG: Asp23/Gls24 family envelope stress response protein [Thermoleophilia bacterium]
MPQDDHPTETFPTPPAPEGAGDPPVAEDDPTGRTRIADGIVAKVAANAAREVDGVEALRGGAPTRGWLRASERQQGSAAVKVADGSATVALRLVVRYGVAIPDVVEQVRARVIERVEFATAMTVTKVDIDVVDVIVPSPPADEPGPAPATPPPATPAAAGT